MAGALDAPRVVGAAFGEVFQKVKHVGDQTIMFNKSILKSLESTVDGIAPEMQNWPPLPASIRKRRHKKQRRQLEGPPGNPAEVIELSSDAPPSQTTPVAQVEPTAQVELAAQAEPAAQAEITAQAEPAAQAEITTQVEPATQAEIAAQAEPAAQAELPATPTNAKALLPIYLLF
ncbi:hypothetical protein RGQ29_018619 [Quercus rubra]|uniref:Uncharacterized protein n=1 Tax=Quercus rubra TaxID=3512 RepID=A0AAN7IZA3_QUERU|nr:hypothetical protein RGQ29_018619 [Quercus rubra]